MSTFLYKTKKIKVIKIYITTIEIMCRNGNIYDHKKHK